MSLSYLAIMKACLRQATVTKDDRDLYDLRYFYVDEDQIGRYTCGVAFEAMLLALRTRTEQFCVEAWYSAVRMSTNPVVQGFLAEQICLSSIAKAGLTVVDESLGRMETATFETVPEWQPFLNSGHSRCLFLPTAYNFKAVDGVILLLNRTNSTAHMFPIQITLSVRHRDSDDVFYTRMWWNWVRPLEEAGFHVQSTFVWIDKNQPTDEIKPTVIKSFRSGSKVVRPEYRVVRVGIGKVDRKLAFLGMVTCKLLFCVTYIF